jgi:glycosyltransferase involved in cell wall biosynthesis
MPFFPLFTVRLVSLLKGKKMYATWNEVWGRKYWQKYMGISGILAYIIEKISVFLPNEIITISDQTKERIIKVLGRKQNIIVVPNGVDIERISSIKPAKRNSDIIFAGRLLAHKNIDLLIRSVKILITKYNMPNLKCLIIGEGPERRNLEKLTKALKLRRNVHFLNFLEEHDQVYALMKSSRVFVLPSEREGFGLVVLEANACGIPVVVADHIDNQSRNLVVDGVNGYRSDLSEKSLAENIKKALLLHPKKMDDLSWQDVTLKIEEVYRE